MMSTTEAAGRSAQAASGGRLAPRVLVLWTLLVALASIELAAAPSAEATGATYNLIRCHTWNRAIEPGDSWAQAGYSAHGNKCGQAVSDWSYQIQSVNAVGAGRSAMISWSAPPGTAITHFGFDHDTRTADRHHAEVQVGDFGGGWVTLYRAPNEPGPFRFFEWGGLWHQTVRLVLHCSDSGGCPRSDNAHAFVRNVNIQFADAHDPSLSVSGSFLEGGWKRGSASSLIAGASDVGSGVRRLDAVVNGVALGLPSGVNCEGQIPPWTIHKVPCGDAGLSVSPNTAAGPFRDGDNWVRVVVEDFAGNARIADYNVKVDNAQPSVAFSNGQDPEDPELIRAPVADEHSSLASVGLFLRPAGAGEWQALETRLESGEARARVDSLSLSPGEYEFRATARDVAGNVAETTERQDGEPMRLTLPLREPVSLEANLGAGASKGQTIPYGTDSSARGRLLDAAGEPIAGKSVVVVENFGDGALIRQRPTTVVTDDEGRWSTKLPAGPTRTVSVSFGGTRRYAPREQNVGKLAVKSRASFETTSRNVAEGEAMVFKGKVGHFGARIPSGGKLLELQVRLKAGRWDTVGEAFRTEGNGRYERRYRFGKHYSQDVLFRFRVKVQKERNWPYKRSASKQRRVIVRAR